MFVVAIQGRLALSMAGFLCSRVNAEDQQDTESRWGKGPRGRRMLRLVGELGARLLQGAGTLEKKVGVLRLLGWYEGL
jgi:hypothetical protein